MRRFALLIVPAILVVTTLATGANLSKKRTNRLKPVKPPVARVDGDTAGTRVLAMVDGKPYTLADWNRDLPVESRQAARTAADRLRALDQLFEPRLLLMAAERDGAEKDSVTAVRLENARRQILINAYLEKVIRPLATADSASIAASYNAHLDDYKIKESVVLRHLQTATRAEAEDAREKLLKGADFGELAKKISTDPVSKDDGGAIGSVNADGFFRSLGHAPALAETLLAYPAGRLTQPIQYNTAWHVFRIELHEPAHTQPLDAVKDQIKSRLERENATRAYRATLERLKVEFGYTVRQNVMVDSSIFMPSPEELFRQAQGAADPNQRIDMYRDLIRMYPGSPFCAQAQFMIGFVYSEELSDYDHAEKEFKALISGYPKSELVKSAQWMLENMRKGTPNFDLPDSLKADSTQGAPQKR